MQTVICLVVNQEEHSPHKLSGEKVQMEDLITFDLSKKESGGGNNRTGKNQNLLVTQNADMPAG